MSILNIDVFFVKIMQGKNKLFTHVYESGILWWEIDIILQSPNDQSLISKWFIATITKSWTDNKDQLYYVFGGPARYRTLRVLESEKNYNCWYLWWNQLWYQLKILNWELQKNTAKVLSFQNNAQPHVAKKTCNKLTEL